MWTACQVMVVLCICSVKGSTTFTAPINDSYSFLFCMLLLLRSSICVNNIALSLCSKFQLKIASMFSKLPGKMLRSFRSQLGAQNTTNIAWNVLWTASQPSPGSAEEILVQVREMYRAI